MRESRSPSTREKVKIKQIQKSEQNCCNLLKIYYTILKIFSIIVILFFTYLTAYYIFYPKLQVESIIASINNKKQSRANLNHLPKHISQPIIASDVEPSENSQSQKVVIVPRQVSDIKPKDDLTFGVRFDDFSNDFYINLKEFNLYEDKIATAVIYSPIYDWKNADSSLSEVIRNSFQPPTFNKFKGPYNDQRCLANNCLVQKANELYYNEKKLTLPPALQSSNLISLSIASLSTRWLIGATLKDSDAYLGLAYYFDGQKFTLIKTPRPLTSFYFGVWGFGGNDNDFLMIYGAYKGIAYHVQGDIFTDISRFFSYRAMNNGFKAEVIRANFGSDINWYVYSSTLNHPWFFKLWQNGTSHIVGEVFLNSIFNNSIKTAAFKLINVDSNQISLLAKLRDRNGQLSEKVFIDKGFNNKSAGILLTKPLSNPAVSYQINIYKIYDVKLKIDKTSQSSTQFLFSADGHNWQSLIGKSRTDFMSPATSFYLKVIFPPENNRFYSPYLDSMLFSYYWKKAD